VRVNNDGMSWIEVDLVMDYTGGAILRSLSEDMGTDNRSKK